MQPSFEQALIEVWRQALDENAKVVVLRSERYPVRSTPKRGLRQVDFVFDGNEIRGLDRTRRRNPGWASSKTLVTPSIHTRDQQIATGTKLSNDLTQIFVPTA